MGFLVPAHSLGLSQVMPVTTSQASCIHCQEILRTTSSKASSLGIRSKTSPTCTLTILNAIRLGTLPYRPSQFTWSWNIEANSFMVLREELIPTTANHDVKQQCAEAHNASIERSSFMSTSLYRPTGLGALTPRPEGSLKAGARRAFWSLIKDPNGSTASTAPPQ